MHAICAKGAAGVGGVVAGVGLVVGLASGDPAAVVAGCGAGLAAAGLAVLGYAIELLEAVRELLRDLARRVPAETVAFAIEGPPATVACPACDALHRGPASGRMPAGWRCSACGEAIPEGVVARRVG